jgi:hypothetical protein
MIPMEQNKAIERFKSLWASHFKALTQREGLEDYIEFVLKSEWNTIEYSIQLLSEQYQAKKENNDRAPYPNLGSLKGMYFTIKRGERDARTGEKCATCNSSGSVMILMYNGRLCNPREPFPAEPGSIKEYAGSCSCGNGNYQIPQKVRNDHVLNMFGPPDGWKNRDGNVLDQIREYIGKCEKLFQEAQLERAETGRDQYAD